MSEHYFYRAAGRSLAVAQDFFRAVDLAEERAKKLQDEIGAKSYILYRDGPICAWVYEVIPSADRLLSLGLRPGRLRVNTRAGDVTQIVCRPYLRSKAGRTIKARMDEIYIPGQRSLWMMLFPETGGRGDIVTRHGKQFETLVGVLQVGDDIILSFSRPDRVPPDSIRLMESEVYRLRVKALEKEGR